MELNQTELLRIFAAETEENLAAMEEGLLGLEAHPENAAQHVDQVFRAAHTLKGNSSSLGFAAMAALAHDAEHLLDRVRRAELSPEGNLVSVLLAAVDAMKRWLPSLQTDRQLVLDETQRTSGERLRQFALEAPSVAVADVAASTSRESAAPAETRSVTRTIRLDAARMDALLDLAGEITIAADRTRRKLDTLPAAMRSTLIDAVEEQDRLLRELHETVMKCRMVPIGPTFRRHLRTVRDLERSTGKSIRLTMDGEDVEVDMTVVEALADPLVHLIRNAIDHGIEPADVRRQRGKDSAGLVRLTAHHERETIVVNVIDDGDGIAFDRVRRRAVEMGIDAGAMPDAELLDLIFNPGFSTAETVTSTSGRGVGMDVVRRNVERVRGKIQVDSKPGEGTSVTIRLPLTLAVIAGFVVGVGGELFVLPMSNVAECLERTSSGEAAMTGVLYVRGDAVPFLALRPFLGFGESDRHSREVVIVVEHEAGRAGLVVDEVIGEAQTVIKPAGPVLCTVPGITGTAVMGNGSVAMVIDPAAIFREVQRQTAGA